MVYGGLSCFDFQLFLVDNKIDQANEQSVDKIPTCTNPTIQSLGCQI